MNKLIELILGQVFKAKGIRGFDKSIPHSVILYYFVELFLKMLRGFWVSPRFAFKLFVGSKSVIKNHFKIQIESNAKINIGNNVYIDALSHEGLYLADGVSIQKNCTIECSGTMVNLGKGIKLHKNVGIGANTFIGGAGGVEIGQDTIVGNYVSFHPENHVIDDLNIPIRLQGVKRIGIKIGPNCWIGAKATILDGVNIGAGSVVAAGAVVKQGTYPENVILGGVPAKIIRMRDGNN